MEFSHDHVLVHAFRFINRYADRHATRSRIFAQPFANDLVLWRETLAAVDDKNDRVGFGDGL